MLWQHWKSLARSFTYVQYQKTFLRCYNTVYVIEEKTYFYNDAFTFNNFVSRHFNMFCLKSRKKCNQRAQKAKICKISK